MNSVLIFYVGLNMYMLRLCTCMYVVKGSIGYIYVQAAKHNCMSKLPAVITSLDSTLK